MDDYRARKRPHTYDDYEERSSHSSKRTHYDSYGSHSSHSSPEFMFKVLCPSIHVGAVIGKGGSVIQQITDDTGANIKISQTEEYFPGTNDRVVCIIGRKNPLVMATTDIVERILEVCTLILLFLKYIFNLLFCRRLTKRAATNPLKTVSLSILPLTVSFIFSFRKA